MVPCLYPVGSTLNVFVLATSVKLLGAVLLVVTAYPTIPDASSVAVIAILFVVAVAPVTIGFVVSMLFIA